MDPQYYSRVRKEIVPLLPERATRILDVGAASGATSAWVKSLFPGSYVIGLEGFAELETELRSRVDEAHIVDLDGALPDVGPVDLALFLDVLEHLRAPGDVLRTLTAGMPVGGRVIVSLPNVAHLSVSLPLLRGHFTYRDSGILDRTHLRFFVRESVLALLEGAGFEVVAGVRAGLGGPRASLMDKLTFGLMRDQLTKQYIVAGVKTSGPPSRRDFDWAAY